MAALKKNTQSPFDADTVSAVAREVIARLGHAASAAQPQRTGSPSLPSKTSRTAASIEDRVITSQTISRLPSNTVELFIPAEAVVTPSARDEARARGIAINDGGSLASGENPQCRQCEVIDFANPARAAAVAEQLSRRSITTHGAKIILSDTPARDLYHQCIRHGEVAAMVGSVEEARRFASELDATVWVLDMKRLNLTAAVNVAAQISRTGKAHR